MPVLQRIRTLSPAADPRKSRGRVADNTGVIDFCPMLDGGCGCYCVSSDSQLTTTSRYAIADPEGGIITRNRLPSGDNCQRWLSLL